ncbi:hypothetical protein [Pseudomonas syringae]|uniref:hypothetical protein n=1 Tax=Pseudomonas syringae TaxID=317 RepID=UPI0012AFCEB7|nr:hypothetical protein [Pseudomonas syringae]
MKKIAYYAALPETMTNSDLDSEFRELLEGFESGVVDRSDFLRSLLELSDRQWHAYSVIEVGLRGRVERCLISLWDGYDLDMAENVINIMVRLGLKEVSKFLGSLSPQCVSLEVFNEVSLALSELGASVSDPYSGMR